MERVSFGNIKIINLTLKIKFMKYLFIIFIFLLSQCSLDNKTGIWKNSSQIDYVKNNRFKDFETLYTEEQTFNEIILPSKNLNIKTGKPILNYEWPDENYQPSNNLENFSYKNLNEIIYKSKRLSRFKANEKILFDGSNIIASDRKGNIIIFSTKTQKIIFKYNFYKKSYKKIKKTLHILYEKEILYISDNLGFFYALNYKTQKLIWAKNYKIPFRSNLKIVKDNIVAANQSNTLFIINKKNGNSVKLIPTEENLLKNEFINSISLYNDQIFYLNTYGSLYSLNTTNFRINWFININQSVDQNATNLFNSNQIINYKNLVIISSDPYLYILNSKTGSTIFKIAISSIDDPIILNDNLFLITKDNLIVCFNLEEAKIIYSVDVGNEIANFLETKQKQINIKHLYLLNSSLFVFLNNSYLVKFDLNGRIKGIDKLKAKLATNPIFINQSILFLDKNNKLVILN